MFYLLKIVIFHSKLLVYWRVAINIQDLAAWPPKCSETTDGRVPFFVTGILTTWMDQRPMTAFCAGDLPSGNLT